MSKENSFAFAFAVLAIIMVVLQMIYPEISPCIGLPIVALLGVGFIILLARGIRRGKKAKSLPTGFGFHPIICEPKISVDIEKSHVVRYGQPDQAIEVALTVNVDNPPVNIVDLKMYMGNKILKRLYPKEIQIEQRTNKECYTARYKAITDILKVLKLKDTRAEEYHIVVVAMEREFPSKVFPINYP